MNILLIESNKDYCCLNKCFFLVLGIVTFCGLSKSVYYIWDSDDNDDFLFFFW